MQKFLQRLSDMHKILIKVLNHSSGVSLILDANLYLELNHINLSYLSKRSL